ncbi:MAG TPA: cytochrome c3 family protein [Aestuariivirgaceae bacterium]|nr:cytochrome c3 family protein [Aestuariivirgaceae bacterium]
MTQHFGRRASTVFRIAVLGGPLLVAVIVVAGALYWRSDAAWGVGQPADQPIPFRHDLHVGGLGLDCRYCHSAVERAATAGMPSARTCLTCHSQVWEGLAILEPLRTSVALDVPVPWQSVHRLPDFSVFHHGAHVQKGVACETCHGRIDQMERTVKTEAMSMGWCLECHRDPEPRLRPTSEVFEMGWIGDGHPPIGTPTLDAAAARRLTDCSTCHK